MKNKLLTFVLTAMACLISPCLSAETYNGTCGENLTWTLDTETGVLTISGTGKMYNYFWDYAPAPWKDYSDYLITIILTDGVTSIGDYAFSDCSSLTSIEIPNSVTRIGDDAFSFCTGLTSITIPNSVTSIGWLAFDGCQSLPVIDNIRYADTYLVAVVDVTLSSYTIQKGTRWIGDYAFSDCSSLTSIEIPNSVTSIGEYAFWDCSSLTSVEIPENVTTIGRGGTFQKCTALTSVKWNAKNCNIEKDGDGSYYPPFHGLSNITDFQFGKKVEKIPVSLCYGLNGLESIEMPNSVTDIEQYAFRGCSSLTSVEIPGSVTSIGDNAFAECSGLTSVTIPNSVTSIGKNVFNNCSSLTAIEWNAKKIGIETESQSPFYSLRSQIISFTFGNAIDTIPTYLCNGMTKLNSVTFSKSVTTVISEAFKGCTELSAVHISDLEAWCKIWFGNIESNPLYYAHRLYLNGKEITDMVIPDNITSIPYGAFCGYSGLTSVKFNDKITSIDYAAFYKCDNLKSVVLPNSVTTIGDYAFTECSSLTSATFNGCVTKTGYYAFGSCPNLTTIVWNAKIQGKNLDDSYTSPFNDVRSQITSFTFGNDVDTIPASLCSGMSQLTSVTIGGGVKAIGNYAFNNCSSLTAVHISDLAAWCNMSFGYGNANPLYLAHHLFVNGKEITDLVIPDKVTTIRHYAFGGCTSLTSVTIPNSVKSIDYYVFEGCKSIKNIVIGENVTSIGGGAFNGCEGLSSITIPQNVDTIGNDVFQGCANLTTINWNAKNAKYEQPPFYSIYPLITSFTFGGNVEVIPQSLCYRMSNLPSVTIPNSVISIGDAAFEGCTGLTSVEIPNSVMSIGNYIFAYCSGLKSVTIPNSVTSIGDEAFYNCSTLPSITIPNSVKSIGYNAFYDCSALTAVHISDLTAWCTITFEQDSYGYNGYSSAQTNPLYYAKHLFLNGSEITELEIPEGITAINPYAFINAGSLTSVGIPQSVTAIAQRAFSGCSAVKRIYCHAVTPPAVESESLANYNAYLYVPCANFEDYDLHDVWGNFKHIECLPEDATALDDTMTNTKDGRSKKVLHNGTICIQRDGILYDLQGKAIR